MANGVVEVWAPDQQGRARWSVRGVGIGSAAAQVTKLSASTAQSKPHPGILRRLRCRPIWGVAVAGHGSGKNVC